MPDYAPDIWPFSEDPYYGDYRIVYQHGFGPDPSVYGAIWPRLGGETPLATRTLPGGPNFVLKEPAGFWGDTYAFAAGIPPGEY